MKNKIDPFFLWSSIKKQTNLRNPKRFLSVFVCNIALAVAQATLEIRQGLLCSKYCPLHPPPPKLLHGISTKMPSAFGEIYQTTHTNEWETSL
jgi:hypothetical protein